MKIKIETSARHIHLSKKDLEKLFGKGYELKKLKDLSQGGEFAAAETVEVIGPKKSCKTVRVLGPVRENTQVELSRTDAIGLGIDAPFRLSGDIKKSAGALIKGPKGEIKLKEGVIVAKRHLHISPSDAKKIGVKNKNKVRVEVGGTRGIIFDQVIVRIKPNYHTSMHIDTDEANAAGINGAGKGEVIK